MKSTNITHFNHSGVMQSTLLLVLSAETALFGTLVMSYLFLRNSGSNLPFVHPKSFDLMIASLNTLILLASAGVVWNAQRAIAEDKVVALKNQLVLALMLGTIFVVGQIFEFQHSGMRIDDSTFGGVFFALISFHAFHVLAGMIVLALNVVRARLGDFSVRRHVAITVGTWFWYYVVAVWIVLFTVLYLI